jgi:hypothetical protein
MAIIRGLKNIEAIVDKPKYDNNGPKIKWLKLDDGQSVQIRFVAELDADSPHYEEKRGLSLVVKHKSKRL